MELNGGFIKCSHMTIISKPVTTQKANMYLKEKSCSTFGSPAITPGKVLLVKFDLVNLLSGQKRESTCVSFHYFFNTSQYQVTQAINITF